KPLPALARPARVLLVPFATSRVHAGDTERQRPATGAAGFAGGDHRSGFQRGGLAEAVPAGASPAARTSMVPRQASLHYGLVAAERIGRPRNLGPSALPQRGVRRRRSRNVFRAAFHGTGR